MCAISTAGWKMFVLRTSSGTRAGAPQYRRRPNRISKHAPLSFGFAPSKSLGRTEAACHIFMDDLRSRSADGDHREALFRNAPKADVKLILWSGSASS